MSTILDIIAGHLADGTRITPTPTAMAVTAYFATLGESVRLTFRKLAGDVDRDVRSVRRAIDQLIGYGLPLTLEGDTIEYSVPVQPMESEYAPEVGYCGDEYTIEPVEVRVSSGVADSLQMSLFDAEFSAPENSAPKVKPEPVAMAACKVTKPQTQAVHKPCASVAQAMHNPCTSSAQTIDEVRKSGKSGLAEAMERLAQAMPSNISTRDTHAHTHASAPVQRINQELILNQSTKVNQEEANTKVNINTPAKNPKFDPDERERRFQEVKEKIPSIADYLAGTLANMMAYGTMPEAVFYKAIRDAKEPTVRNPGAFLNAKISEFKKHYRYCKSWKN